MLTPTTTIPEIAAEEEKSLLLLWKDAVGKVFKLTSKSYGIRSVTYTQVKTVKETESPGCFEIEVSCAEVTAKVLNSKRGHSSVSKDGVIELNEESILTPSSFGEECRLQEYEKLVGSILIHTTTNLDLVTQPDLGEKHEIEIPIDLPHLKLTDMEASLLRNSPFLIRNAYLLSENSRKAAYEAINQELRRASRSSRLTDVCDSIYVEGKNAAVASLRDKLNSAVPEANGQRHPSAPTEARSPALQTEASRAPLNQDTGNSAPEAPAPKTSPSTGGRLFFTPLEKRNSIVLALRGKPSPATLSWEKQNPSKEGAVYRLGKECGLLEFTNWAHITGRAVTEEEATGRKARTYFSGSDASYSGPDKDGVYPLFKLETVA